MRNGKELMRFFLFTYDKTSSKIAVVVLSVNVNVSTLYGEPIQFAILSLNSQKIGGSLIFFSLPVANGLTFTSSVEHSR